MTQSIRSMVESFVQDISSLLEAQADEKARADLLASVAVSLGGAVPKTTRAASAPSAKRASAKETVKVAPKPVAGRIPRDTKATPAAAPTARAAKPAAAKPAAAKPVAAKPAAAKPAAAKPAAAKPAAAKAVAPAPRSAKAAAKATPAAPPAPVAVKPIVRSAKAPPAAPGRTLAENMKDADRIVEYVRVHPDSAPATIRKALNLSEADWTASMFHAGTRLIRRGFRDKTSYFVK